MARTDDALELNPPVHPAGRLGLGLVDGRRSGDQRGRVPGLPAGVGGVAMSEESTTHRLFREAAAQAFPVGSRRKPVKPTTSADFEAWWETNHEAAAWDRTWANVDVVKEIASRAWEAAYRKGTEDQW
jgi:hypothetical protein